MPDVLAKLHAMFAYAQRNERFNSAFLTSLADAYDKWGRLTEKQEAALDKIIKRFRVRVSPSVSETKMPWEKEDEI